MCWVGTNCYAGTPTTQQSTDSLMVMSTYQHWEREIIAQQFHQLVAKQQYSNCITYCAALDRVRSEFKSDTVSLAHSEADSIGSGNGAANDDSVFRKSSTGKIGLLNRLKFNSNFKTIVHKVVLPSLQFLLRQCLRKQPFTAVYTREDVKDS